MAQLTKESLKRKNFKPEDFFASATAQRLKINNTTDNLNVLTSLMLVADKIQEVRDLLGQPIKINSAYRCPALNKAVGSKPNSQHVTGNAVDFICPKFGTPEEIVGALIDAGIEVDQCLLESSWVHLSIKFNNNRNQFASLLNGKFTLLT